MSESGLAAPLVRVTATVASAAGAVITPLALKVMAMLAAPPMVTPVPAEAGTEPATDHALLPVFVNVNVTGTALPNES